MGQALAVRRYLAAGGFRRAPAPGPPLVGDVQVVVAHPDDEILWLAPAVERAASVVACYAASHDRVLTRARERVRVRYPCELVYLPLVGANVYRYTGNGAAPCAWGVDLAEPPDVARRYAENFETLVPLLEARLTGA